jgi:hypothetical protein
LSERFPKIGRKSEREIEKIPNINPIIKPEAPMELA